MLFSKLEELCPEVAAKLSKHGIYMAKLSAAVETSGEVVDAVRMMDADAAAKMNGYTPATVATWFEFATKPLDEQKACDFATESSRVPVDAPVSMASGDGSVMGSQV